MRYRAEFEARLRTFQWSRGLRAAVVMGSIMVVCHLFGVPPGAAAIGGFDALLVDNGGPYRTRLITMAITLAGGSIALVIGCLVPSSLVIVLPVTVVVCFAIIFGRVLSQPFASSSLLILVLYFAGLGGVTHTLHGALLSVQMVLLGGLWAALLSLMFWPIDPFRPARLAVADCYESLAKFTAAMSVPQSDGDKTSTVQGTYEWRRHQRAFMESARTTLAATVARAPSRTVRARNLTVLLETSDLLFARVIRLSELEEVSAGSADHETVQTHLRTLVQWLAAAEHAIREGLASRPADAGASFGHEGSQRVQFVTRRRAELAGREAASPNSIVQHVATEERDALFEIEVAFDALRAIWTGADVQRISLTDDGKASTAGSDPTWLDAARANFTLSSAMMRHALRMSLVGAADVVVMRLIHVNHGYWLPMTSIILLQPYSAGTARKSVQRVSGTVAGGMLAAVLAAALPGPFSMIFVITILSSLTLATYAVDYAIYCFFLTPTFVLMSLPHAHDWRYAGIRIGTTLAGASIAIAAMRLLWPERAEVELGRLLRRGVEADAQYLRATIRYWSVGDAERRIAERDILAPARRACGLASNDAEEAVDRVMQEPSFGSRDAVELAVRSETLTFATYLRRLTQSITTLAVIGRRSPAIRPRLERLAARLDDVAAAHAANTLEQKPETSTDAPADIVEEQMQRIERQTGILERAARMLALG